MTNAQETLRETERSLAEVQQLYIAKETECAKLAAVIPDLIRVCIRISDLLRPEVTKEPERTIFWEAIAAIAKAEGR